MCQCHLENHNHVVAYASQRLSKVKCTYDIFDWGGMSIIFGIMHFLIEIDHSPLKALFKSCNLTCRLAWWALVLQTYNYGVHHKLGQFHSNANAHTCMTKATHEPYSKLNDLEQHRHFQ